MKDLSNENVIHIKKDGIQYIQFKKLLEYKDKITHAYTTGIDKTYKRDEGKDNYKILCNAIGADFEKVVYSNQLHTDRVENLDCLRDFSQEEIKVDGLMTNKDDIILSTINADCILFLFYDPVKNVIANVHSGWRGTLQRISIKTIKKMQLEHNCNPQDIICCICPSIRKCHFEVEQDVKNLYSNEFNDIDLSEAIKEKEPNTKWNIDTVLINKIILENAGIKPENIIDSGICSVCNKEQIHSFRAHKENCGRATAIIGLKNNSKGNKDVKFKNS